MKSVIIQKPLLEDLKESIGLQNKLELDKAVYFVSLINSMPTSYRGNEIDFMRVNLDSQKLKGVDWKAADYMRFLIKNRFIEKVRNHSSFHGKCAAYRIPEQYFHGEIVPFRIWNKSVLEKFDQKGRDSSKSHQMDFCREQRPHLVRWFDENLSINREDAHNEISYYRNNDDHQKYIHSMQLISEWEDKSWTYSIKPETDNRLHTTLTRTNRSLRKHLRYQDKGLVGLDLKTSQPYFLCAILKGLCFRDIDYLERIGATKILGMNLIQELCALVDIDEARAFACDVINEDLYNVLIKIIPIQYDLETGKPFRIVINGKGMKEFITKKLYESERDCMKEVVLTVFNCKKGYSSAETKAFAAAFPSIYAIIQRIKEDEDVEFYQLLSHVEAYCLLDCVAKKIAAKYPEMPLLSIHDSLVTTDDMKTLLQNKMEKYLFDITRLKPTIELENWTEDKGITINNKLLITLM
ncbi:hypothetical protein [Maribacter sp. HTCC2170]|uniref:hypothetical protein n=1 Tax=Maribacter sp. (strain HTCC2170 / KCCM 42371) TaxID=313603 RepID=UPI00006BD587|nr:hypothetical protein [Maribacter sp. HTCC2170]EAR02018.1 hypothetical protein FB2170_02005 [Maribacter sp. HTCC2170]